ncbi:MAG: hypothetical protein WCF28_01595 [Methanobacterium sp.]|uniref:hypothetical protein n=1 Tax=Methanobacterium sp. TaxID=2164 RepID=UPI003C792F0E
MGEKEKTEKLNSNHQIETNISDDQLIIENHLDQSGNRNPCVKCGKLPTKEDHDACIGTLPGVIDACCGHGVKEAYINFENGLTLRGSLVMEFVQANLKNKYR